MTINLNTIRSNIFADVFSVLNGNIADPKSRGKQWIFSTTPDFEVNFVGFPIITISKALISKKRVSFDDSYTDKTVPIKIYVYSTSNAKLDTLCDQVDAVIVPSNFPQFDFKDYSETDGEATLSSGRVYYRIMTHYVELSHL